MSKAISELLWFCITSLSEWFKVLVPHLQQIRSETKTNCCSRVHIFPRLLSATCNYSSFDWFTGLSPSFLIGQSNYFGFDFTTLDCQIRVPKEGFLEPRSPGFFCCGAWSPIISPPGALIVSSCGAWSPESFAMEPGAQISKSNHF